MPAAYGNMQILRDIMLFPGSAPQSQDSSVHKLRVNDLLSMLLQEFPKQSGAVVLFGALENGKTVFRQESSFTM